MRVLFDTNIILDVLLDRPPFAEHAAYLLSLVERGEMTGFVCATSIMTIHYLIAKVLDSKEAIRHIRSLLSLFDIAPVNRVVIENALAADFSDFEDAVIHEAALHAGAKYIVTRNPKDFRKSKLPVFEPRQLLSMLTLLDS